MPQVGFIRSKNEIKYLILYIAERLIAPVPFEVMQELTMCDPAIDFFEFSECLSYLVRTEHLICSKEDLYSITEKGILNGRATADEIPYSVRMHVEELIQAHNQKLKRARQVQSSIKKLGNGTYDVELRFNDDYGLPLWRIELAVPDGKRAQDLQERFEANPEKMYMDIVTLLLSEEKS